MNNFLYSKNLVFRYKSAPRGLKNIILPYIFLFFMLLIGVGLILTIFNMILFQFSIFEVFLFFLFFSFNGFAIFIQIIGIQSYHPFFKEQEANIHFLIYIIGVLQIISFIISLIIWIPTMPYKIHTITTNEFYNGFNYIILTHLCISLIIAGIIFILGWVKINRLE